MPKIPRMKNSLIFLPILCCCAIDAHPLDEVHTQHGYIASQQSIRGAANSFTSKVAKRNEEYSEDNDQHLQEFEALTIEEMQKPLPSNVVEEVLRLPRELEGDDHDGHEEDGHDHEKDDHGHEEDDNDHEEDDHDDHDNHNNHDEYESKPWGEVIGYTILVNVASLSAVIILIPLLTHARFCGKKKSFNMKNMFGSHNKMILDIIIPSFACGALLAASVFLIMPESVHLIGSGSSSVGDSHAGHNHMRHLEGEEGPDESVVAAKFGMSILGGFLLPIVLGAFFPRPKEEEILFDIDEGEQTHSLSSASPKVESPCEECLEEKKGTDTSTIATSQSPTLHSNQNNHEDEENFDDELDNANVVVAQVVVESENLSTVDESDSDKKFCKHGVPRATKRAINYRLCASILIGDAFHNFADGIFVGTAFMLCSKSVAFSIVAATLYHEIAQEIADFFLLTGHGGLGVLQALCLNFISGLSVMLGGIIVLAADLTSEAIGVFLAIAGGVYIHIAASECVPRVDAAMDSWKDRMLSILMFVLGAVPIGLVLLDHKHC